MLLQGGYVIGKLPDRQVFKASPTQPFEESLQVISVSFDAILSKMTFCLEVRLETFKPLLSTAAMRRGTECPSDFSFDQSHRSFRRVRTQLLVYSYSQYSINIKSEIKSSVMQ